jgi:hypothetical protein
MEIKEQIDNIHRMIMDQGKELREAARNNYLLTRQIRQDEMLIESLKERIIWIEEKILLNIKNGKT